MGPADNMDRLYWLSMQNNECFSVSANSFENRRNMIHPVTLNYFCALRFPLKLFYMNKNMVVKKSSSKYSPLHNIKFIFATTAAHFVIIRW